MATQPWWRRYWRSLGFRREVGEELEFHVAMLTKELIGRGMDPEAAQREAARRFGDRQRVQNQLESIERRRGNRLRLGLWLAEFWHDARLGFRGLLKRPAFTFAAVSSLGLGIASVTVVISIVDTWLLKPLAVERPDDLVIIGSRTKALGRIITPNVSLPTIADIRAERGLFAEVAAWRMTSASMRRPGVDQSELGWFLATTANYFDVLGVRATLGRTLAEQDGRDRQPVVVLNHYYWRQRLGADPAIVGQSLLLNGVAFTVIGVLPSDFDGTEHLIRPVGFITTAAEGHLNPALRDTETRRDFASYQAVARKQPGVSIAAVRAGLDVLVARLVREYPDLFEGNSLAAFPERQARPTISTAEQVPIVTAMLMALGALVLGTAAVNVANLILARASGRREELTVRLALGASRWRLVRQMLTESLLLGGLSFVVAGLLAKIAVAAIAGARVALPVPVRFSFETGGRVMLMSLGASLAVGLLAGFGPALIATRESIQSSLRRSTRGGASGGRLRAGLLVAQVAAAVVTLVSAGLLTESGRQAARVDLGINPTGILTTFLEAEQARLDPATAPAAFDRIRREVEAIPGVTGAAFSTAIPLTGAGWAVLDLYLAQDNPAADRKGAISVLSANAEPNYFDLMGIPIRSGRPFAMEDDPSRPLVAVVNERAAEVLWPGQNPIGQTFRQRPDGPPVEVIGVAANGRYVIIVEAPRPLIYLAFRQHPGTFAALSVKSHLDQANLEPLVRSAIGRVEPDLAPAQFETMEALISNGLNGLFLLKAGAYLAAAIGILALVLTVVGLYGVLAFSVSQETREIGLRMALGAEPGRIIARVLSRGGRFVAAGLAIGLVLAVLLTRQMGAILVGVGTTDVRVYGTVAALLVVITAAAAYLPARRASRLDPVRALRTDG
jgi:predicted permease